jgi:hypothetical protein
MQITRRTARLARILRCAKEACSGVTIKLHYYRTASRQLGEQDRMLIEWQRVPRASAVGLAVLAHVFLVFLLLPARTGAVHLVPHEFKNVEMNSGRARLVYGSKTVGVQARRVVHTPRNHHQTPVATAGPDAQTAALNALRQQASTGAKALTRALWFRQIYGFYPEHDYQLAFRTSGEIHISADELPPRFEQFVILEVTIGVDGHVADTRRVSGLVPPAIEQKLR